MNRSSKPHEQNPVWLALLRTNCPPVDILYSGKELNHPEQANIQHLCTTQSILGRFYKAGSIVSSGGGEEEGGSVKVKRIIGICTNRVVYSHQLQDTLTHELIHALDDCRRNSSVVGISTKTIDHYVEGDTGIVGLTWPHETTAEPDSLPKGVVDNPSSLIPPQDSKESTNTKDCAFMACTEIRAANLSGDCRWSREMLRGHLSLPYSNNSDSTAQQTCTQRRAVLSLAQGPCAARASEWVDLMWASCNADRFPFPSRVPFREADVDAKSVHNE